MRAIALLAALALAPAAGAMVLPSEVELGAKEARILARAEDGRVRVETEPVVLAAAAPPGGEPGEFAPTPRVLDASFTWRGIERVVVIVLRRAEPDVAVEVTVEDDARTGVSLEWPAEKKRVPLAPWGPLAAVALAAVASSVAPRRR